MDSPQVNSDIVEAGERERSPSNAASSPENILIEAVRRAPILEALQDGPARPSEITDAVDASRSTIHRATDSLEDRGLITQSDGAYELTNFGKIVAQETIKYSARVGSASSIEPFLNTTNRLEELSLPIEHFETARVTKQSPREPHTVIHRLSELMAETNEMRLLSTILSPIHVEMGYREMMNGTDIEAVFEPDLIDIMLTKYPEKAQETIDTGRFTIYVHDSIPFELFIFDEKMGMAAHHPTGQAEVIIESDEAGAIAWAVELYEEKRAAAEPLLLND